METRLFELTFKNGSTFRVFTANKRQTERLREYIVNNDNILCGKKIVANGIHTIKQFENIMKEGRVI